MKKMKQVKSPKIKLFIYDVIMFDDDAGFDEAGNRVTYKTFPKELYKAHSVLKNKLQSHCNVYLYDASKNKNDLVKEDLTIIKASEFIKDTKHYMGGKAFLAEVFESEDILELSGTDLAVIKHYYSRKKEIPISLSVEDFEEFEKLIAQYD